jgi:hypothetical protein
MVLVTSEELFLDVNVRKTKNIFRFRHQNAGKYHNVKTDNKFFKILIDFRYFESTLTNENYFQMI